MNSELGFQALTKIERSRESLFIRVYTHLALGHVIILPLLNDKNVIYFGTFSQEANLCDATCPLVIEAPTMFYVFDHR